MKAGKSLPCVFLFGPEEYLLRRDAEQYIDSLVPVSHRDFNLTWISGDKLDAKDLRSALAQLPISGPFCVLCVENAGDLKKTEPKEGKNKSEPKDRPIEVLKTYLEKPNPALRLVLFDSRKGRDLKGKPIFELLPLLRSYEYGYLPEGQRFDWTKKYVEKYGKSITDEAASYLLVSSTEALSELAWKLDHAALFVGETSKIDIISVQRVLGITSSVSIFDLERAIHKGSLQESLKIARRLLEGGEPVLKAIAYLHSSLILLWGVIRIPGIKIDQEEPSGEQRSQREEDLRRVLGKRYWVKDQNGKPAIRDSFVEAAKAVSFPMIERALMGLLDLEITLKTRTVEEDLLFYHWLCQIMLPNGSTPEPQMEAGS